jgi:hypothetical protein
MSSGQILLKNADPNFVQQVVLSNQSSLAPDGKRGKWYQYETEDGGMVLKQTFVNDSADRPELLRARSCKNAVRMMAKGMADVMEDKAYVGKEKKIKAEKNECSVPVYYFIFDGKPYTAAMIVTALRFCFGKLPSSPFRRRRAAGLRQLAGVDPGGLGGSGVKILSKKIVKDLWGKLDESFKFTGSTDPSSVPDVDTAHPKIGTCLNFSRDLKKLTYKGRVVKSSEDSIYQKFKLVPEGKKLRGATATKPSTKSGRKPLSTPIDDLKAFFAAAQNDRSMLKDDIKDIILDEFYKPPYSTFKSRKQLLSTVLTVIEETLKVKKEVEAAGRIAMLRDGLLAGTKEKDLRVNGMDKWFTNDSFTYDNPGPAPEGAVPAAEGAVPAAGEPAPKKAKTGDDGKDVSKDVSEDVSDDEGDEGDDNE